MPLRNDVINLLQRYIDDNRWWKRLFNRSKWSNHHLDRVKHALERFRGSDWSGSEIVMLDELARKARYPGRMRGHFPVPRQFNAHGTALIDSLWRRICSSEESEPISDDNVSDHSLWEIAIKNYRSRDQLVSLMRRCDVRSEKSLDSLAKVLRDFAYGKEYSDVHEWMGFASVMHRDTLGVFDCHNRAAGNAILEVIEPFGPWEKLRVLAPVMRVINSSRSIDPHREALANRLSEQYQAVLEQCRNNLDAIPACYTDSHQGLYNLMEHGAAVCADHDILLHVQPEGRVFETLQFMFLPERNYESGYRETFLNRPEVLRYLAECTKVPDLRDRLGAWFTTDSPVFNGMRWVTQAVAHFFIPSEERKPIMAQMVDNVSAKHKIRLLTRTVLSESSLQALNTSDQHTDSQAVFDFMLKRQRLYQRMFAILHGNLAENSFLHWFYEHTLASIKNPSWVDVLLRPEHFVALQCYVENGIQETTPGAGSFMQTLYERIQAGDFNEESAVFIAFIMGIKIGNQSVLSRALSQANTQVTENLLIMLKQLDPETQQHCFWIAAPQELL